MALGLHCGQLQAHSTVRVVQQLSAVGKQLGRMQPAPRQRQQGRWDYYAVPLRVLCPVLQMVLGALHESALHEIHLEWVKEKQRETQQRCSGDMPCDPSTAVLPPVLQPSVLQIFLGTLREIELERVKEKLSSAIMETCLALTIFREEFNIGFVGMFTVLTFVKVRADFAFDTRGVMSWLVG